MTNPLDIHTKRIIDQCLDSALRAHCPVLARKNGIELKVAGRILLKAQQDIAKREARDQASAFRKRTIRP